MILVYGYILIVISYQSMACRNDCITVGIVANGTGVVETEIFPVHEKKFVFVKHLVDTTEVFNIFSSVRKLDVNKSVDVIGLLDYETTLLKMPQILTTYNKKLIALGARSSYRQKIPVRLKEIELKALSCGSNGGHNFDSTPEDIYCLTDLNVTNMKKGADILLTMPVPRAIRAIVKSLRWRSIIIFYESSTEMETSALVDGLSMDGVLFAMYNIDHVTNVRDVIQEIIQTKGEVNSKTDVVTVCRFYNTKKILMTANAFDAFRNERTLLKMFSRWLVVMYNYHRRAAIELTEYANNLDNIAILAVPELRNLDIKVFYKGIDCTVLDILRENTTGKDYSAFRKKFIDRLEQNAPSWNPTSKCQGYHIETLLWTEKGRVFSHVGYADINGKIVINTDIFPNTKYGYNKRSFLVSTLEYSPFVIKRKVNNSVIYEGFCMDLLEMLANKLNFTFLSINGDHLNAAWIAVSQEIIRPMRTGFRTLMHMWFSVNSLNRLVNVLLTKKYNLTEPADGKWGGLSDPVNVTFNGLVGQLQREEVDIVAAPISVQSERDPVMDFSYPYYYEYTTVLVKKPDANATKWRTLIDPFKLEVLLAIGAALLIVSILAFLIEKYNPFYDIPQHAEDRKINGGLHTWHSSFWYVFGALLCQGGVHLPESTAGRTLISCWWLTCIIIVGTYCGNLVAFLTVTMEKPPFNTLQEMNQLKGTYKWGTIGGTAWESLFPNSINPAFRATGKAFVEFNKSDPTILHQNPAFHVNRVKEEKYAWIGDKTYIEIAMATECSLVSIKEEFMPLIYVFGFKNNSPHAAMFSRQMIKIHEVGLLQIWKRKWWPKSSFCAGNSIPEAKPISLMDVQSAFYVCFIGIFAGLTVFFIEIILYKCRPFMQKRRNDSTSGPQDEDISSKI